MLRPLWAAEGPASEALQWRIAQLAAGEISTIAGNPIAAVDYLSRLYDGSAYDLLWNDAANRAALRTAIEQSVEEGLTPGDFHWDTIRDFSVFADWSTLDAATQADFDMVFSDALARLIYQLYFGKVNPLRLDPDWNFSQPLFDASKTENLLAALQGGSLSAFLEALALKHPYYLALKEALQHHRDLAASGGWGVVESGRILKTGDVGPEVAALRLRLRTTGELSGASPSDPALFDDALKSAVRRFQERHGLDADGVVGEETLLQLNVPVTARIDQIRVNLERARWVLRSLGDSFIVVNIAGFYLYLIENNRKLWETSVIVGTPYRKTPVFTAAMTYLEFNPTWTVPLTILRQDIIPKVQADPNYLSSRGFFLADYRRQPVAESVIDWHDVDADRFPYLIIQKPGPGNALGLVKFMFPNKHEVYLHDTPSRNLFKSSSRSFSSGCIRVKDPFTLAKLLLHDRDGWSEEQIAEIVARGTTERVTLRHPLPVLLLYWTVDPDSAGEVRFYRDIYDRDEAILTALGSG